MATLALGILGSALLSETATAGTVALVGAATGFVGSILDNAVLFPALFPQDAVRGPQLDGLRLTSASEGSPVPFCVGPKNRVGGAIIWKGPLIEESSTSTAGGKGGGQEYTEYRYYVDLAVEACEAIPGGIDGISKIWADGKLIFEETPNTVESGSGITAVQNPGPNPINPIVGFVPTTLDVTSPSGEADLSAFLPGVDVTMAGWSGGESGNNGTWRVVSSSIDANTGISTMRLEDPTIPPLSPVLVSGGPTAGDITFTQDRPNFRPGTAASMTVYTGTDSQSPDPTIESYRGSGDTNAFRHRAYVVFERFSIEEWGRRIPQFSFEVRASASETTGGAIAKWLARAGVPADRFDVSACTDELKGYTVEGPQQPGQVLQAILASYDIAVHEDNDVLKFFPRGDAVEIELSDSELGAADPGQRGPYPAKFADTPKEDLPPRVSFAYVDEENALQPGSEVVRVAGTADDDSSLSYDSLVTLTAAEARCRASQILYTARANARKLSSLNLAPSRADVLPADIVSFGYGGATARAFLTKLDRGWNYQIQLEGVCEQPVTHTLQACVADAPQAPATAVTVPPQMELTIIDIAPLTNVEAGFPAIYYGGTITDPALPWKGGRMWVSTDGGSTYNPWNELEGEAVIGRTLGVLAAGSIHYMDRANTIDVDLMHGALASVSRDELDDGANRAVVGGELIGFQTATLIGTRQYRLSNLLRGLQATESAMSLHSIGDRFVQIEPVLIKSHGITPGQTLGFKVVPSGGQASNYTGQLFTLTGRSRLPMPPSDIRGTRDASDNLTILWTRRTRNIVRGLTDQRPVGETVRQYEVELAASSGGAIVRTMVANDLESVVYTAAMQTADSVTPGATVYVTVYQMSAQYGRGRSSQEVAV